MTSKIGRSYIENVNNNVSKREQEVLTVLISVNKLKDYAPWAIGYSLISFFTWNLYWTYFGESTCSVDQKTCSVDVVFDENSYRLVSYGTSGVFASSLITQILQLMDADVRYSFRLTPVYCTAVINLIAFITHLSMAEGWFPTVVSVFGRVNHVARWGEWISVVPLLMIMMNSIDVRNNSDVRLLWEASISQLLSVSLGGVASVISVKEYAYPMMILSCSLYIHIYYVLLRALHRYNVLQTIRSTRESNTGARRNKKKASASSAKSVVRSSTERSTKEMISQVEQLTAYMSVKLALLCTITWTVKVLVYGLGVINVISQTQEAVFQSIMDCVSKSLYARVLCNSHGVVMSPESLLSRVLHMEEQANASIRQFLRFVYHEVATPLNTVSMSVHNLSEETLSKDGQEILDLAKTGCVQISDILNDLLNFQEVEDGSLSLTTSPTNFKTLVRSVASQFIELAREKGVTLLLAIDPRIPDVVLCEKVRIRQVITILISNGVNFAQLQGGTCAILAELKISNTQVNDRVAHIRFGVRDDGSGFSDIDIDRLFTAYSTLSTSESQYRGLGMSLCAAKQIIELHGGILNVDSAVGKGSTFYFDVDFPIPSFNSENDPFTSAEVLENMEEIVNANQLLPAVYVDNAKVVRVATAPTGATPMAVNVGDAFSSFPTMPTESLSNTPNMASERRIENTSESSPSDKTEGMNTFKNKTALVVDDSSLNRKLLVRTLQRMGFTVDSCDDGDILVKYVLEDHKSYDCIFLDNNMPRLRGVDAVRQLRAGRYPGFVLGVTGNMLRDDLVEFINAGCNDVIMKPVTVQLLTSTLIEKGFGQ